MASYLSECVNYVRYNRFISSQDYLKRGVPQGSNLRPLFFWFFIDDPLMNLLENVMGFAHDIKLYHAI